MAPKFIEEGSSLDFSGIPLFDAHCHAPDLGGHVPSLEGLRFILTESRQESQLQRHLPHSISAQASLRLLSDFYGCGETIEELAGLLDEKDIGERCRNLADNAGITSFLFDHRFPEHGPSLIALSEAFGRPAYGALRIESLAEDLLSESLSFEKFMIRFQESIAAYKEEGGVALKSIIAYRSGLRISRPEKSDAATGYESLRRVHEQKENIRIGQKPLLDFLLWASLDSARQLHLPFQIHTGLGDSDIDLPLSDPALLRPIFEENDLKTTPVVLLHAGYPYVREAGFLAATYENAFVDISLATPLLAGCLYRSLEDLLSLAPFSKVLYGSDGHTLPEMHWLGATWARIGFQNLLGDLVDRRMLTETQAERGANLVFWKNAHDLYKVKHL